MRACSISWERPPDAAAQRRSQSDNKSRRGLLGFQLLQGLDRPGFNTRKPDAVQTRAAARQNMHHDDAPFENHSETDRDVQTINFLCREEALTDTACADQMLIRGVYLIASVFDWDVRGREQVLGQEYVKGISTQRMTHCVSSAGRCPLSSKDVGNARGTKLHPGKGTGCYLIQRALARETASV